MGKATIIDLSDARRRRALSFQRPIAGGPRTLRFEVYLAGAAVPAGYAIQELEMSGEIVCTSIVMPVHTPQEVVRAMRRARDAAKARHLAWEWHNYAKQALSLEVPA